jgi:hypothetical protein
VEVNVQIAARLTWDDAAWGSPLVHALAAGTLPPALQSPRAGADWMATACRDADPQFLSALVAEMPAARAAAWAPLATPGARAVVTGQQPGCAGGALLVLYKAATAVVAAARATAALGRPVVPVFWNATDDEDFEEIASIGWPAGTRGFEYLELPRAGRRAGAWVGDLPASGDEAAAAHALETLDALRRTTLARFLPRQATDHGDWVGALLAAVFPELAILDARSAALRRAGAALFERYLAHRAAAPEAVRTAGDALRAAGFTPGLAPENAARALYLTEGRQRQKLGEDLQPLEAAIATRPEHVSPSVMLRPLLQDAVLPVLAQVVGPSEVAYLLELRLLRQLLQVPEPALVVRASATLLDAAALGLARGLGLEAGILVRDPESALRAVARARAPHPEVERAVQELATALAGVSLPAKARERIQRRVDSLHAEILGEMATEARAALTAASPALAALPGLVRPRGRAQERQVAGLWALAAWGGAAREALLQIASAHLDALAAGRGEHYLVTL